MKTETGLDVNSQELEDAIIEWFDRDALKPALAKAEEGGLRRWAPLESWRPSRTWTSDDDYDPTPLRPLFDCAMV